jgi:hypothetical protein
MENMWTPEEAKAYLTGPIQLYSVNENNKIFLHKLIPFKSLSIKIVSYSYKSINSIVILIHI